MDSRMEALKNAAQVRETNGEPPSETRKWATSPTDADLVRSSFSELSLVPENEGNESVHGTSGSRYPDGEESPFVTEEKTERSSSNPHDAGPLPTEVLKQRRWNARTFFSPETPAPPAQQFLLFSLAGAVMSALVIVFYLYTSSFEGDGLPMPPAAETDADPAPPDGVSTAEKSQLPRPDISNAEDRDENAPIAREEKMRTPNFEIKKGRTVPRNDQLIAAAYEAYRRGDFAAAHEAYWKALRVDPNSRNALIGLAAISARNGDLAQARELYLRLINRDPNDPLALAGLLNLQAPTDHRAAESQIKSLLNIYPGAAHLHSALGDLYAAEGRWPEAHICYEKAFALDEREALAPEQKNPDFAFNLAVSLEHLGRHAAALRHYRAALDLATYRKPLFDAAIARARIDALALKSEE